MKFSNILAVVALATGAVSALPTAEANDLAVREPKGGLGGLTGSLTKQLKQLDSLLTTIEGAVGSGTADVSSLLSLVGAALSTVEGLLP